MKTVFIILFSLLSAVCYSQVIMDTPIVGNKIIPQKFITLDSTIIEIGNQKEGKFMLVDFYFTSCRPCNENIIKINKLRNNFKNKLDVLSVNTFRGDNEDVILQHQLLWKIDNPIIWGDEARKVAKSFKRNKYTIRYPYYILISPNNEVVFTSYNSSNWHKKIEKLLQ